MKRLRTLLLSAVCFALAWGAVHFVRTIAAVGEPAPRRAVVIPDRTAPVSAGPDKVAAVREAFANTSPGGWSALWQDFASHASIADLEKASQSAVAILPQLADEELALRTGKLSGSAGTFAALAEHDPAAAWAQARKTGNDSYTSAVLRVMVKRNPADAMRRALKLPAGRPISVDEAYGLGRNGEVHTPLGSVFAAWARRDPRAAGTAVESLPSRGSKHMARREIAVQWAYRDGPAALRFVMDHAPRGAKLADSFRMDYILRAAFYSDPAGTAKLMSENGGLRAALGSEGPQLSALKPSYRADPQGFLAWLRNPGPVQDSRAAMWLIGYVVRDNPLAAAPLIREFPKAGHPDHARNIAVIARLDPALGRSLADELGLRPQVEAAIEAAAVKDDPAAACDRWLAAVRQHGAQGALTALGWSSEAALELAAFASHALPERAKALAAVVPASVLVPGPRYLGSESAVALFWKELAPQAAPQISLAPNAAPKEDEDAIAAKDSFTSDPAAAAGAMLAGPPGDMDAAKAVAALAPHDFAAARAWLSRVPEGPARQQGELALAIEQAPRDPLAALQFIASLPDAPQKDAAELWTACLQRLVFTGGDWQSWLAKAPALVKNTSDIHGKSPEQVLTEEAKLLAALRKSAGKPEQ